MTQTRALMGGVLAAASVVACDKNPVGKEVDPQFTMTADSITVDLYKSASVGVVYNSPDAPQYVSRDPNVATVSAAGAVTGVSIGSTYVVASLSGRPNVRDSIRVRVFADSCSGQRPDFGGLATAADRALFSYDVNAPLNLKKTFESSDNGVEVSTISYASPDGGLVTGLMWDPVGRSGLRPGMLILHGMPATARDMSPDAMNYARHGAVVIAIDAPFARRTTGPKGLTFFLEDRTEQIQLIKDMRRAVDVLRAQPNVDDDRIGFMGASYGGSLGALFVGVEPRLNAAALVVGHAGQVSHFTGPAGSKLIASVSCERRLAWVRAMTPIEPLRFVGSTSVPLLLQNGKSDEFIPVYEAEELHAVAPPSSQVRWYSTGHNLNLQAIFDRHDWLVAQIGIDPR